MAFLEKGTIKRKTIIILILNNKPSSLYSGFQEMKNVKLFLSKNPIKVNNNFIKVNEIIILSINTTQNSSLLAQL